MPEEIVQLSEALDRINSTFKNDFFHMDFFFCYKNRKVRTIFNVIRSLPNLLLRPGDDAHPSVTFESTWTNVNLTTHIGRRSPNGLPLRRGQQPSNYFAHSFMGIPLVTQVNCFSYGFEILSEAGIDMIVIKSACLVEPTIATLSSLVGQTMWSVPPVHHDENKTLEFFWRKPFSDDFDDYIKRIQHGAPPQPNVSVDSRKNLILDDGVL